MKRLAAFALAALLAPAAFSASTATVTPGDWDLYRGSGIATRPDGSRIENLPTLAACAEEARLLGIQRTYTCRTRAGVSIAVTQDSCPPKPADETLTQQCPAGTSGTWQQTRAYISAPFPTCWSAGPYSPAAPPAGACPPIGDPPPPTGRVFYGPTSLPACVTEVTQFSFTGTAVTKQTVTAAASGLPARAGRCLAATPSTLRTVWAGAQPGDYVTLAAGTYSAKWGEGDWYNAIGETWKKGTAALPIDVVAAPGAAVTMDATGTTRPALAFGNGDRATARAEYLNFSGFAIRARASCVSGGGHTTEPSGGPSETGGLAIRIVGIECTITDASSNTMTGLLDLQNDGWRVLGNTFRDPANRVVINNNHGVYIQGGADDVEVAYNVFVGLHMGHVIQIHQDANNPGKRYERLAINDNYFRATNYNDMRGIAVINVDDASTVNIRGNRLEHLGWSDWGCLNVYGGTVTVDGLQCLDTHYGIYIHGPQDNYGGAIRRVIVNNAKICPSAGPRVAYTGGASANGAGGTTFTETNPQPCP